MEDNKNLEVEGTESTTTNEDVDTKAETESEDSTETALEEKVTVDEKSNPEKKEDPEKDAEDWQLKYEISEKRRLDQEKYIGQLTKARLKAEQESIKLLKLQKQADQAFEDGDIEKGKSYIEDAAISKKEIASLEKESLKFENRSHVLTVVPDFEELRTDILDLARKDGVQEELLDVFRNDPFSLKSSDIIMYARRVQDNKRMAKLEEELKKTKMQTPQMLKDIEKATNRKSVTNSSGNVDLKSFSLNSEMSDDDIAKLPKVEREAILKKLLSEMES